MQNDLALLALGWLAFAAAALSPGPNLVAVAARSLGAGRAAGQRVALGVAGGAFLWAILAAAGLGQLLERVPELIRVLSWIGGAYLGWLGFKGLRSAWRGGGGTIGRSDSRGAMSDVGHGLAVTLSNPKVALVWLALGTLVGPATASIGWLLLFASVTALLAYAIYGGYGLLFSLRGARALYDAFTRTVDALFGALFATLGLSLLLRDG